MAKGGVVVVLVGVAPAVLGLAQGEAANAVEGLSASGAMLTLGYLLLQRLRGIEDRLRELEKEKDRG